MTTIPRHGALGGARRRRRGAEFNPSGLFANGEVGVWYDPSDLTPEKLAWVAANPGFTSAQFLAAFPTHTLYTTSTGTTPVTALGQSVGLVLDKSQGALTNLGAELVTNGDFSGGTTGWTLTNASIANGELTLNASASVLQNIGSIVGALYEITYTITAITTTTGTCRVSLGTTGLGTARSTTGTFREYLTPAGSSTNALYFFSSAANFTSAVIDNVTVKLVPGHHAIQSSLSARPTLQARSNLLTRTEEFENADWTKNNATISANATSAPDGTTTADKLNENAVTGEFQVRQTGSLAATFTASVYAKKAERDKVYIQFVATSNEYIFFDLTSGTVAGSHLATTTNTASRSSSIVSVGNGWYRCSITITLNTAAAPSIRIGVTNTIVNNTPSYAGTAGSGIFIWGAQLELGSTATTYQRVVTATDYADIGLPRSFTFDGIDDSFVTAGNVNFSGTDKMTVCAGVFKQTDAAGGMLINHEPNLFGVPVFFVTAPEGAAATYGGRTNGSGGVFTVRTPTNFAAPRTDVLSVLTDNAASGVASFDARVNSVSQAMVIVGGTTAGAGNYGTTALHIGQRRDATLRFNGRIHQLIIRGAATDSVTIQQTERFVAQKTGINL